MSVDVCGRCGGVWLDAGELGKLGETDAAILSGAPARRPPTAATRHCPRCLGMKPLRSRPQGRVVIDECAACHGIWLDAGELAAARRDGRRAGRTRAGSRRRSTSILDPVDIIAGLANLFPGI